MSRHGARVQRQQATERAAARRLLGTLLEQARAEGAGVGLSADETRAWWEGPGAISKPRELETPSARAGVTPRDLYRWAILVAIVCGGLLACGMVERC